MSQFHAAELGDARSAEVLALCIASARGSTLGAFPTMRPKRRSGPRWQPTHGGAKQRRLLLPGKPATIAPTGARGLARRSSAELRQHRIRARNVIVVRRFDPASTDSLRSLWSEPPQRGAHRVSR